MTMTPVMSTMKAEPDLPSDRRAAVTSASPGARGPPPGRCPRRPGPPPRRRRRAVLVKRAEQGQGPRHDEGDHGCGSPDGERRAWHDAASWQTGPGYADAPAGPGSLGGEGGGDEVSI